MKSRDFAQHILLTTTSVFVMTFLFAFSAASASRPTVAAPNGNPTFPPGPVGPQGPQGPQGGQGGQGPQGYQGTQGPQGASGSASCSINGSLWLSHGWDGNCAWSVGVRVSCSGGQVTGMTNYYYTGYGTCGYMCYGGGACFSPS